MDTLLAIKQVMPTLPAALAEEWIAPFVDKLGPPKSSGRWLNILLGYPLEFWRNVSWTLEPIDLRDAFGQLNSEANFRIVEMERAFFEGMRNDFSRDLPNGKTTTLEALEHLRTPPPALLRVDGGQFEIVDGNHRMLAYALAMRAFPPEADELQDVWIGRHDG